MAGSLDAEGTTSYELIVAATDNGQPSTKSVTGTVTVTVTDVNEFEPTFTVVTQKETVAEGAAVGTT